MASPIATQVAIVGAGPVGLLLANLIGDAGIETTMLEKRTGPAKGSMAIGITPPSLDILGRLRLDESVCRAGVRVRRAIVHEERHPIGTLSFADVPGAYPFIVSLPQSQTEALLSERLLHNASVNIRSGRTVTHLEPDRQGVLLRVRPEEGDHEEVLRAEWVVACDGAHGVMRELAGIPARARRYAPGFTMADAPDLTGLGEEAHLFFSAERPVESFPLPNQRRRWIVRTGWRGNSDIGTETLPQAVARLTGHHISADSFSEPSPFQPMRRLAHRYVRGRVILCGDAAHLLSPIGGQGMNIGFGDAAVLARALIAILLQGASPEPWLAAYERARRHAFRLASARAAMGMSLGVLHGAVGSQLRRGLVRQLLSRQRPHDYAARWFAMRSLPHPLQHGAPRGTQALIRMETP